MYNDNVPGGHYRMANRVQVFDPPRAISWEPGMDTGDGNPQIVGHIWRYDLAPAGPSGTKTTLSYDWSAVPDSLVPTAATLAGRPRLVSDQASAR